MRPSPRVKLRAGAFGNWVDDLISTEAVGITNGVRDFRYVNVARARTAGGDVSATFEPVTGLSTSVGYAYLFTRDDSLAAPLPSRPPHTGLVSATSNHPGGVNVGFADGSVKFIKDTINLQTWWALGSRNGGEIVSADAY